MDLLDETLAAQGVGLSPGDLLLVRTGYPSYLAALGGPHPARWRAWSRAGRCSPGCGPSHPARRSENTALEWPGRPSSPFRTAGGGPGDGLMHPELIALLGIVVGELWRLDELAADCADDGITSSCWWSSRSTSSAVSARRRTRPPSSKDLAAVDVDRLTGHHARGPKPRRAPARRTRRRSGCGPWRSGAGPGTPLPASCPPPPSSLERGPQRRTVHGAGEHGIDADAIGPDLAGEHLRGGEQRRLRCRVGRPGRAAPAGRSGYRRRRSTCRRAGAAPSEARAI